MRARSGGGGGGREVKANIESNTQHGLEHECNAFWGQQQNPSTLLASKIIIFFPWNSSAIVVPGKLVQK